jgi:hypothetical protein
MISTHWAQPKQPSEGDLQKSDILAHHVADSLCADLSDLRSVDNISQW